MSTDISFNKAWKNIFDHYKILDEIKKNHYFDITADEIKAVDRKEPRLMTKVDFRENLPEIMQEEKLSILAIKNGLYRVAKNDPFINVSEQIPRTILELNPPENLISIDPYNIKSESAALDIAAIAGMHNQVFGEESHLAIRGRLRGNLKFHIDSIQYDIDGVQIEVDGGYESKNSIHLVEAKIGYRNNINIRQLLYPKLFWEKEVQSKKSIEAYIFYLQNDIYRFIPYCYDGKIGYADHSKEKAFRFKPKKDAIKFSLYTIPKDESKINNKVPFPQADKFEKVVSMISIIADSICTNKEVLRTNFDIVDRQIDYYYNVLKWLKIVDEVDNCLILNNEGLRISNLSFRDKIIALSKIVFSEPIMNNVLHNKAVDKDLFEQYRVASDNTITRRLQTVQAWIKYFKSIIEI